ncbi:MAG: AMP-binding protein [Nitrospirae bacterium]|nr:AMP-binding protein [Nitrospirota bacterium]
MPVSCKSGHQHHLTIPATIPELVAASSGDAACSPDKIVLRFWENGKVALCLTKREFMARASAVSAQLAKLDVPAGGRVALIGPNHPDWCVSYLGIVSAGAVAVPLDAQMPVADMAAIFGDCEPSAVIYADSLDTVVDAADPGKRIPFLRMGSIGDAPSSPTRVSAVNPDDIASIIYTSGTTGRPKGVMLSHANFCSNAAALVETGIIRRQDSILGILPLHHVYPFMVTFLAPLAAGATVTYLQSLKGPEITGAIRDAGITILPGVPRLFTLMRKAMQDAIDAKPPAVRRMLNALASLSLRARGSLGINPARLVFAQAHKKFGRQFRFFVSGGARLDPEVSSGLESLGFTILEGYGLSETSPVAAFNRLGASKRGSVGQALPGVSIRIAEAAAGADGEVLISGPNVMKGYYRMPEETAAALKDGWLHTGDLGFVDADGFLHITGRNKEVIVLSSGKNVYPEDVEKHFLSEPVIGEICICQSVGGADAVEAVIVPGETVAAKLGNDPARIQAAVREAVSSVSDRLPPYQRPRGFRILREPLPRTPLGKLRRFKVREMLQQSRQESAVRKLSAEEMAVLASPAGRRVAGVLRSHLADSESTPIRPESDLEMDLGIDSLGRIEIFTALNIGTEVDGASIRTVKELVAASDGGVSAKMEKAGWDVILRSAPDDDDALKMRERKTGGVSFFLGRCLVNSVLAMFFGLRSTGRHNLPDGPFIIAANHESYLDGFAVSAAAPRNVAGRLFMVGLEQFFRGPLSSLLTAAAWVIPIDTERHLERAMRMSAEVLRHGNALCIFPEGGRSFDGELMEFKNGAGILAVEMNVPIVPCFIEGAFEAYSRHMRFPASFRRITVTFGKPVHPSAVPAGTDRAEVYAETIRRVRNEIELMKKSAISSD